MEEEHSPIQSATEVKCRLGKCEVCAVEQAKYSCPKCEVKTCSLTCNKIHKNELECNGQRDRTKFIPLNKFTNLDLLSDYRFLEEVNATVQRSRKKFGRVGRFQEDLPIHLSKLRAAAFKRKTHLKFLPRQFSKHRNNATRLDFKTDIIKWQIEWIFVNSDNLRIIDAGVLENDSVNSVLHKYLQAECDEALQEKLQYYQAVGQGGVKVLLNAEQKKGAGRFYEVDSTLPLKSVLQNKVIVEHPTFYVVLRDHCSGFDVIDSDNEEDSECTNGIIDNTTLVNKLVRNAEKEERSMNNLKNLLFASDNEVSDEEKD